MAVAAAYGRGGCTSCCCGCAFEWNGLEWACALSQGCGSGSMLSDGGQGNAPIVNWESAWWVCGVCMYLLPGKPAAAARVDVFYGRELQ